MIERRGNRERQSTKEQTLRLLRLAFTLLAVIAAAALSSERASGQEVIGPSIRIAPGGACLADFHGQINLVLHDPDGSTSDVTLSARSSNTTLVPNDNIRFGGSGDSRTATIETVWGKSGSARIEFFFTIPYTETYSYATITVQVGTYTADVLSGNSGPDILFGGNGRDTLRAGEGIDLLCGGASDDTLEGGGGDDTLDGGAYNDTLRGGYGADRLTGGSGSDHYDGGPDTDIATNFSTAEGDSKQSIP
jgi:Ca2+-binding RTX toxin-like protein